MNQIKRRKPPGVLTGIISCIPMFNWIALIILGLKCGGMISLFCGIVYGFVTFKFYDAAPFLWMITIFQYLIAHAFAGNSYEVDANMTDWDLEEDEEWDEFLEEEVIEEKIIEEKVVDISIPIPKEKVELDFSYIEELRKQSDVVRAMLEVVEQEELREEVQETLEESTIFIDAFIDALSVTQKQVLAIILAKEDMVMKLTQIAEQEMSMPEILIDEINEIALQHLDDILIDTFGDEMLILEQYEAEIRKRIR